MGEGNNRLLIVKTTKNLIVELCDNEILDIKNDLSFHLRNSKSIVDKFFIGLIFSELLQFN